MKKLSLILALIMLMSVVLISCAQVNAETVDSDSEGTTEGSTTAATSSPDVTTTGATTAPAPLKVPEPENPEPIYVGMTEAELREVEDEMKELSNDTFLYFDGVAFWIDENGNNAVAEIKKIDDEWKVASIDRYFPAVATAETFDMINNSESITIQEIVKLVGIPYRIGPTSGFCTLSFRDIRLTEQLFYGVSGNTKFAINLWGCNEKDGLDKTEEVVREKYSLEGFIVHRVFLEKNGSDEYLLCLQGAYGDENTLWTKKFVISDMTYDNYANYRSTQKGVLYNAVITEEFDYIFYDVHQWLFLDLHARLLQDNS